MKSGYSVPLLLLMIPLLDVQLLLVGCIALLVDLAFLFGEVLVSILQSSGDIDVCSFPPKEVEAIALDMREGAIVLASEYGGLISY